MKNNNKRFIVSSIIAIVFSCISLFSLSGCFLFAEQEPTVDEYEPISTIDELMSMNEEGYYVLTNDIDLGGRSWAPLSVQAFDGGGHTISNCIINGGDAFFLEIDTLSNVTFDSIYVTGGISICGGDRVKAVEAVTVKNSTLTVANSEEGLYIGLIGRYVGNLTNCKVEDSEIVCGSLRGTTYVGGMAGLVFGDVEDCSSTNIEIRATHNASSSRTRFCVGGLIGAFDGLTINRSNVIGASIEANATYQDSGLSVGGLVGNVTNDNGTIAGCSVSDSSIEATANTEVRIGGLFGIVNSEVTDSCSVNNQLYCDSSVSSNCYIGGFCASAMNETTSCFAANNTLSGVTPDDNVYVSGFSPNVQAAINFCGVFENVMSGTNIDEFAFETNLIFNSLVTDTAQYDNRNSLESISSMEWYSPATIEDKLRLDQNIWSFKAGELPYIIY